MICLGDFCEDYLQLLSQKLPVELPKYTIISNQKRRYIDIICFTIEILSLSKYNSMIYFNDVFLNFYILLILDSEKNSKHIRKNQFVK